MRRRSLPPCARSQPMLRFKFYLPILWLCAVGFAEGENTFRQKSRTFHSAQEFHKITGGDVKLVRDLNRAQLAGLLAFAIAVPSNDITVLNEQSPEVWWVGTRQGAFRLNTHTKAVEYFAGMRWLPDDQVTGIGFEGDAIWIETARAFSRIEYKAMTLADKS